MKTIAVIDDDVYIGNMLEELLTKEGFGVLRAYSGTEALLLLDRRRPDLVLLDRMLPGLQGEEILPRITGIPVIIVSAKAETGDKVQLLLHGAADYITKPFDTAELLARITVQLRGAERLYTASSQERAGRLVFGDLELDMLSHVTQVRGQAVHLTKTEYAILKRLMLNPSGVVTKSGMLELIAPDTPDCTESSLKVHVANLRKKLREAGGREYIEAVWGIGYKLFDD